MSTSATTITSLSPSAAVDQGATVVVAIGPDEVEIVGVAIDTFDRGPQWSLSSYVVVETEDGDRTIECEYDERGPYIPVVG